MRFPACWSEHPARGASWGLSPAADPPSSGLTTDVSGPERGIMTHGFPQRRMLFFPPVFILLNTLPPPNFTRPGQNQAKANALLTTGCLGTDITLKRDWRAALRCSGAGWA